MSSTSNTWTVASKKGKVASSPKGKKQKPFTETMPRIEPNLPVEESPTIYSVFRQEEERKEQKLEKERAATSAKPANSSGAVSASSLVAKKNVNVAKKVPDKKKDKAPTVEELLALVTVSEMESVLANDKVTFPDNPDVWLKDLASLLNLKLDKLPIEDPTYSNKASDYPASLLSKQLKNFMVNVLTQSSVPTLRLFLDHCIDTMMSDISKGIPSYGYHIFVQLLLQKMPQIGITSLPAYLALLKDNISRPQRALCILWAIGQAGLSDIGNGLKVWIELMLPVLNIRTLVTYSVHYLESLFRRHPTLKPGASATVFPKREFFMLFDELFSASPSLAGELRHRMIQMYPKLKVMAFGAQPETTLRNFFASFLSRCSADCGGSKRAELLECLVKCLCVDKQSFSTWRQIYVKHLSQSSILMQHLASRLETSRPDMDTSLLRETVRAFSVTNDALSTNRPSSLPTDFDRCVTMCNELLMKLSKVGFPSHWFLSMFLVLIIGVLGYDVYSSGGLSKCWTYRTLLAAGVIDMVHQAWTRLCLYTHRAWIWLADNVPSCVSTILDIVLPYLMLLLAKISEVTRYCVAALKPHWQVISSQVLQFITWLNTKQPLVLNAVSQYIDWFLQSLVYITVLLCGYLHSCVDWVVANVLTGSWSPDNIMRIVMVVVTSVQSAALALWHSIVNLLS